MAALIPSVPNAALRQSIFLQNCGIYYSLLCPRANQAPSRARFQLLNQYRSIVPHPTQQRRTFLVQLRRQAQSFKRPSSGSSEPSERAQPGPAELQLQLTNLPYLVRRTASNQLPVYLVTKAGGTKQQTKIQKAEGDLESLRRDLTLYLDSRSPKNSEVTVNPLNGHVVVKGWRKPEIQQFLLERSF